MTLDYKNLTRLLFVLEEIGGAFVIIFLAAYLAGIPTTAVLHSEPAFKIPLLALGVVFLLLIFSVLILAVFVSQAKAKE